MSTTDTDNVADGALTFSYPLTATVAFTTTVTGTGRQIAAVSITNSGTPMWNATLLQAAPTATLTYDLALGSVAIKAGALFTLTVPSSIQPGNVVVACTTVTSTSPAGTPFSASIANWPLISAT